MTQVEVNMTINYHVINQMPYAFARTVQLYIIKGFGVILNVDLCAGGMGSKNLVDLG